jgi:hypothetical protein
MADESPKVEIFSKDAKNEITDIVDNLLKDSIVYDYDKLKDRVTGIIKIYLQEKEWEDKRKKREASDINSVNRFLIFIGIVVGVVITLTVVKGFGL